GSTPLFALFAEADAANAALVARHGALLERQCRPPFAEGGIWLVRPDGYVAMVAERGEWAAVGDYLDRIHETRAVP
ncbi:MAG: hypothetical protein WAS21_28935, partial [Geminicoccaceae bacterium]